MGYVKVVEVGRVYAMEPGDRVLRSGLVERPDGTIVSGKAADPRRIAQWQADGLIEKEKPARKSKSKSKSKSKAKAKGKE